MAKDRQTTDKEVTLGELDSNEMIVLRDALRYFSERMTPMFLKREGVRLLNYDKGVASHLASSLASAPSLDVNREEKGIIVESLRYFSNLPTPMYGGRYMVAKLRKSQEIARKLLRKF